MTEPSHRRPPDMGTILMAWLVAAGVTILFVVALAVAWLIGSSY